MSESRSRTKAPTERQRPAKLTQAIFKSSMPHLHSKKVCSSEEKEFPFAVTSRECGESRKNLPLEVLQNQLNITLRDNLRVLNCLQKKEGQCRKRHEYIEMVNWLKTSLEGMQRIADEAELSQEIVYEYLNKVYAVCFSEIIELTRVESAEKAEVLKLICDNVLNLSIWLDKYYRNRLATETHKHAIKCEEDSRRYLFQIQELQDELAQQSKDKTKKDGYFYQVVRDNRKLRRQNNKLLVRLKYQNDSNHYLKEENIKFYKENEKMKLVMSEEDDRLAKLEALTKRLMEVEKRLLCKNKITRNNVMKEVKEEEIKERLEDEIKMIVKRIDQEELLDLDYYEPPRIEELHGEYQNYGLQTEYNTETKATNTPAILTGEKKKFNQQCQTAICTLKLDAKTIDVCLAAPKQARKIVKDRTTISPNASCRGNSKIQTTHGGSNKMNKSIQVESASRQHQQEPKTYQERLYRLYTDYESICRTLEGMRMLLINIHHHQRLRIKKDTKTIAIKTYNEFRKLLATSIAVTQIKTPTFKRIRTSGDAPEEALKVAEISENIGKQTPTEGGEDGDQLGIRKHFTRKKADLAQLHDSRNVTTTPRKSLLGIKLELPKGGHRSSIFKVLTDKRQDSGGFSELSKELRQGVFVRKSRQEERISGSVYPVNTFTNLMTNTFLAEALSEDLSEDEPFLTSSSNLKRISSTRMSRTKNMPEQTSVRKNSGFLVNATEGKAVTEQNTSPNNATERPSLLKKGIVDFDAIEQLLVEKEEDKMNNSTGIASITANFASREELMRYFRKAVTGSEEAESRQQVKLKVVRDPKSRLNGLAKKIGFAARESSLVLESDFISLYNGSPIASILGKLEHALSKQEKELSSQFRSSNSNKLYTKNVLRRLFNYLIHEVYKQRAKLLEKDFDFKCFFQDWVVCRYGLHDIYEAVVAKIVASITKYCEDQPEFKCLALLMNCRESSQQSASYSQGIFRLFVLFVEFGTQTSQLLGPDSYNPNASLPRAIEFVEELLKVFLSEGDIRRFVSGFKQKSKGHNEKINLFELFTAVEATLDACSHNTELEELVKAMSKVLLDSTCETVTLEELVVIWQLINPAEPELETNVLRMVKFCGLNGKGAAQQKLVVPLFKLSLLARRFGWLCLLRPVEWIDRRFEECYGGKILIDAAASEKELRFLRENLPEHQQLVTLLESKLLSHRIWSRSKDSPLEPFPVLLYKLTKLCLAATMFNRHADSLFDPRFSTISQAFACLGRKQVLQSISRSF